MVYGFNGLYKESSQLIVQHASQIDTPLFFAENSGEECASSTLPEVETPLGTIAFSIELNGNDVTAKFSDCFDLLREENLFRYELAEAFFELLIFRNTINLLPHQHVEDCLTYALRLASKVDNLELRFSAAWSEDTHLNGGGDTGEGLMAMTWENSQFIVSLGTGDVEWHYRYAGKSFPARWKQFIPKYEPEYINEQTIPFIEQIDQRGLIFELPNLMSGEACQLAFAVAWANFISEDDISTHVAVDDAHNIERSNFLPFNTIHHDKANT